MDALILCGGFAKRLGALGSNTPKSLLTVNGRPVIDHILDDVYEIGVDRIIISTNQKFAPQFENWLENTKKNSSVKLQLVVEPTLENEKKFGAIRGIDYAIEKAAMKNDMLLVLGDNYYDFGLTKTVAHFNKHRKPTICAYDTESLEAAKNLGVVKLEGHVIKNFQEKPTTPESTLVSTGIYVFPSDSLHLFKEYLNGNNNPDAPGYFIKSLVEKQEVHGVVEKGSWHDIGTIENYTKAQEESK